MDALRVASRTKDAPPAWLPNRQWPTELTDPAFLPTVKKRKPCTFEPYQPPHLTSLSAPDGAVPVISSPSCSVSSTKLLVMPSGPFRIDSPAYDSSRETTSRTFYSDFDPPLLRAMSTPAHPSRSSALRDVSPLLLAEPPLLRTSTCRSATRSSLSRAVLGNRIGELATSSSEPFLASDGELPKSSSSNQLTSQVNFQQSRTKREFASCNDVTSTCSLSSGSEWVNPSALASSLRGEKAGRSVADLMDPGRVLVPELGKAVRLMRRKLSQERQHQQQKPPVPLPSTATWEQQKQNSQKSQAQKFTQKFPAENPPSSASVPAEGNHGRDFSLPEILQWEGGVFAKSAGQQTEGTLAMKLSGKFTFCADDRVGDAQPARAAAEGFGGEVRDEDKLCIHELLGQITGEYGGDEAGAAAERMECDGEADFVSNHSVPSNFTPLPAPEAGISASPNARRKRPPPPPPLVDVANVASAAFAEICNSEGGVSSDSPDLAAETGAAGGTGAAVTPPAEASAVASIAATAELPCPTPTGWGTSQWERFFPAEPPTPSGVGPTSASMACAGGGATGGSGAGTAGGTGANGGGFASLWSEAWTEGFNVDLSGLTGNPGLW
ncbi:unnamed protein product [Closterium sp. NIES-53]